MAPGPGDLRATSDAAGTIRDAALDSGGSGAGRVGRSDVSQLLSLLGIPAPLHMLEPDPSLQPRTSLAHCHKSSRPIDPRLLGEVGGRALVCVPALALRQLAKELDLVDIALIAYELCGSYALSRTAEDGFVDGLAPVTSASQLMEWQALLPWSPRDRKSRVLREALGAVVDGSASPMESRLAAFFFLPRGLGGLGLPKALLNHPIPVRGGARSFTRGRIIIPDMCWPEARLVVEYLGRYHDEVGRAARDSERDNALAAMGYDIIDVTKQTARSLDALDAIADKIVRATRCRQRPASPRMLERRTKLHEKLLLHGSRVQEEHDCTIGHGPQARDKPPGP